GALTYPPVPLLVLTCTVNTWLVPTGLSAVCGEIWMFASTNVLVAVGPSPACGSPVERVRLTPPTETVVEAFNLTTTAWLEVTVIEHSPFTVEHGFVPLSEPLPLTIANVTCVPSGAFT